MSALIVYMSLHGCVEKAARHLAEMSWKKVDMVNLRNQAPPPLDDYGTIIVGGSVHIGKIQGKIAKFCNENEKQLLTKRLGLFLCHMQEGEAAVRQFSEAYPEKLREHAVAKGLFGGEFNIEKMDTHEKMLVGKPGGVSKSISRINFKAIEGFGRVIFHLDKT